MCDCIKQVSEAALKHAEKQLNQSNDEKLLPLKEQWSHGIENVGFGMAKNNGVYEPGQLRLKTNIVFQTDFKKKDGTRSKAHNNHMVLMFSYCPFCGESYDPPAQSDGDERSVATEAK